MHKTYSNTRQLLQQQQPEQPLYLFHRALLEQSIDRFQQGFPGLLTYAVKANPSALVINTMLQQGVVAYDVASLAEIELVQSLANKADQLVTLHYHNPVKPEQAIGKAWHDFGVRSYSLDDEAELDKLVRQIPDPSSTELSVRFVAPTKHQVLLDLNTKFGANVETAVSLLRKVAKAGFKPSLTFHPGTQCTEKQAYVDFIA
jgi:ornithine decarboxylase